MRFLRPLAAGTGLSMAAVSGLACLDPSPSWGFPQMSARHPVASYAALAAAPLGSGWDLFALVAFICSACFLVAALRRRARPADQESGA